MVRRNSENCHLNLSLSAVCDYFISWSNSLTILNVSVVGSVKQNLSVKSYKALQALSWGCYHALPLPHRPVILAVPGHIYFLFKLTFSLQILKVVRQEQHHFLWWCPLSFAWVLRIRLWIWIRHKNEQRTVISEYYLVVFVKLYRFKFYQSSGKREYLFL